MAEGIVNEGTSAFFSLTTLLSVAGERFEPISSDSNVDVL